MNDSTIDRLVRDANPATSDQVDTLDLRGADQALLDELMATPVVEQVAARPRPLRSRLVRGVVVAAAVTAAIGVPAWMSEREGAAGPPQVIEGGDSAAAPIVFSAAAIAAAERNPRLLVDEPGWVATTVYGFTADEGTIDFVKGDRSLEVNWYPARAHPAYYKDRLDVSEPEPVTVAGRPGALFRYSSRDFAVMLEPRGGSFVELRTGPRGWAGKPAALQVFAKVKAVDVQTWLAALPPEIVRPGDAREAVEAMLADVPEPPGFDVAPLLELGPSDRYQLGAAVTGAVACGWLAAWIDADRAGDDPAATRAEAALESSRQWKILREMDARGDWPESMWDVADRVSAGQPVPQILESLGDICADGSEQNGS